MGWNVAFAFKLAILLNYFVMISVLSLSHNPDFQLKTHLLLLTEKMYQTGTFLLKFQKGLFIKCMWGKDTNE